MLLELTAGVRITRRDQEREMGRRDLRPRYLEEIARQIANTLMNTPGAVEIRQDMEPETGDLVMRARCLVEDFREPSRYEGRISNGPISAAEIGRRDYELSMKKAQYDSMMDAMKFGVVPGFDVGPESTIFVNPRMAGKTVDKIYFSKPSDPFNFNATQAVEIPGSTLTFEELNKAMEMMKSDLVDPVAFLQRRMETKRAKDETREQFQARQKDELEIKKNTKKPGESPILVKVGVRKIQMPGGE